MIFFPFQHFRLEPSLMYFLNFIWKTQKPLFVKRYNSYGQKFPHCTFSMNLPLFLCTPATLHLIDSERSNKIALFQVSWLLEDLHHSQDHHNHNHQRSALQKCSIPSLAPPALLVTCQAGVSLVSVTEWSVGEMLNPSKYTFHTQESETRFQSIS